jgi:ABC-2 type transport system ATP-binding protein
LFDEAHLGLDAPARMYFYDQIIADYTRSPRMFILSSHLIEEVSPLFQQVLMLHNGRLLLKDETDHLLERGTTVTGPVLAVEAFTHGRNVLNKRRLGPTLAVTIFDHLEPLDRQRAAQLGLELGPVGLQELFVQLTGEMS